MINNHDREVKKDWERFKRERHGERFKKRYEHRQESARGWASPSRLFNVILGTVSGRRKHLFRMGSGTRDAHLRYRSRLIAGEFRPAARSFSTGSRSTEKVLEVCHKGVAFFSRR